MERGRIGKKIGRKETAMGIAPLGPQADIPALATAGGARAAKPSSTSGRQADTVEIPPTAQGAGAAVGAQLPDPLPGELKLDIDRATGRVVGRIVDKKSGRLITQIPSEEALKLAAAMRRSFTPLYSTKA